MNLNELFGSKAIGETMTPACILLSCTLFFLAWWLENRERDEPQPGQGDPTFDDEYLMARRRGRRSVHILLAVSAVLILMAGLAGPGPVWIASWLAVCGLLVVVLTLGMMDFYRTNRYLARKLPQLRQQVLHSHTDATVDVPIDAPQQDHHE